MKRALVFSILVLITVMSVKLVTAAVPQTINYQGYLTDAAGNPVNGTKQMTFKIYNVAAGGSALWTETQASVTVSSGIYNVIIGSATPLNLSFNEQYYLGVEIASDGEMTPRQQLTSAPYALRSAAADTYTETDPKVGTLTNGMWCTTNGTQVNCATAAPVTSETDPTVLTSVKDGVSWAEIASRPSGLDDGDDVGITSESDPQVNTLTSGKWCTSDGSVVNCTSDAPSVSESDPQVGTNTTNYVPKWDGSALVTGSIYDSGTIGIGAVNTNSNIKLYVHRQPNDSGAGKVSIYGYRTGLSEGANGGTGWNEAGVDTAIKAYNLWGNQFTSGIAGYSDLDYASSAAVVGAKSDGSNRGMLGYKDINNNLWAGYFEGDVKVNGGVTFADGTVQTTAAAPTWSQKLTCDVGNCPRFVVLADFNNEAVLDRETGLVWERSPTIVLEIWWVARLNCANSNVGGRKGWLLPTIEQLTSLVDTSAVGFKLPPGHPFLFEQHGGGFWSSTIDASDNTSVWDVDFGNGGYVSLNGSTVSNGYRWCVRGGHSPDAY